VANKFRVTATSASWRFHHRACLDVWIEQLDRGKWGLCDEIMRRNRLSGPSGPFDGAQPSAGHPQRREIHQM